MKGTHLRPSLIRGAAAPRAARPPARLQLTSLVDMMVILVVFLLNSFAVDGQLLSPASGLVLPSSSATTPVGAGIVVEAGPGHVRVAGRDVMATERLLADGDGSAGGDLAAAIAEAVADGAADAPLTVLADRRLDFRALGRILRACAQAGRIDVSLVVLGGNP